MSITSPIKLFLTRSPAREILASVALHLGLLVALSAVHLPIDTQTNTARNPLTVLLPSKSPQPADVRKVQVLSSDQMHGQTAVTADAEHNPARFIVPPELDSLQKIPVAFAGKVSFRLYVSEVGTVLHVEVRRSDPVPIELLDGLSANLKSARLQPAQVSGKAVASTLDITIGYEAIEILSR